MRGTRFRRLVRTSSIRLTVAASIVFTILIFSFSLSSFTWSRGRTSCFWWRGFALSLWRSVATVGGAVVITGRSVGFFLIMCWRRWTRRSSSFLVFWVCVRAFFWVTVRAFGFCTWCRRCIFLVRLRRRSLISRRERLWKWSRSSKTIRSGGNVKTFGGRSVLFLKITWWF